jgi:hypothetical protein
MSKDTVWRRIKRFAAIDTAFQLIFLIVMFGASAVVVLVASC